MQENQGKILIVERDTDNREMLAILLGLKNYQTLTASTMSESLALIKDHDFDLILLGGYFEDGTGVELCRLIRVFDKFTPIFFCSANAYQSEIKKAREAGAQQYFTKPVNMGELENSISHHLHQD